MVFVEILRVAIRNRVPRDPALDIVVNLQRADNVIKGLILRIIDLDVYGFTKLVLERFRAALLHLRFSKGLLVPCLFGIFVVEVLAHGIYIAALQTLLPEKLGHLIKVALITPIRLAVLHIAVANEKVCVDVIGVGVYREQHLIALRVGILLRKLPRYLKRGGI